MAAPPLKPTKRFFAVEISKFLFIPTIADPGMKPTSIEIDAGVDLTKEVSEIKGFTTTANMIPTPDAGSRWTSQIGGRLSSEQSGFTLYASQNGDDVRQILPRGTTGFFLIADGGLPGSADIFPGEVISLGKARSLADNALVMNVEIAITAPPAEDIELP